MNKEKKKEECNCNKIDCLICGEKECGCIDEKGFEHKVKEHLMKDYTPQQNLEDNLENELNKLDAEIMDWVYEIIDINFSTTLICDSTELREILKQFINKTRQQARADERKKVVEEIALKLIEIEKEKWNNAEHCTCLGYAIVKLFGEKYEK